MKNDNLRNILIIFVVVLILGGAVFAVGGYVNKENNEVISNNKNDNNELVNNNKNNEESNKENNNEEIKVNDTFNPYEKYESVNWCGKETSIKDTMFLNIEDNKLVFKYDGKTTKYSVEEGTLKSVTSWINGGIPMFLLLTEEGKVYEVIQEEADYGITGLMLIDRLKEYNIVDMTQGAGGVVYNPVYFLTEEGKLIDFGGFSFEELNLDFVTSFGHFYPIYFDKDGHMSYTDNSNDEELLYLPVKDDYNKEVVAKKVFWQTSTIHNNLADEEISERYAIITESNKLVYLTDNGDVMIESSKVKSYEIDKVKDEEWDSYRYNVVITMSDGKIITLYDTQDYYYDVERDKNIYFEEII